MCVEGGRSVPVAGVGGGESSRTGWGTHSHSSVHDVCFLFSEVPLCSVAWLWCRHLKRRNVRLESGGEGSSGEELLGRERRGKRRQTLHCISMLQQKGLIMPGVKAGVLVAEGRKGENEMFQSKHPPILQFVQLQVKLKDLQKRNAWEEINAELDGSQDQRGRSRRLHDGHHHANSQSGLLFQR